MGGVPHTAEMGPREADVNAWVKAGQHLRDGMTVEEVLTPNPGRTLAALSKKSPAPSSLAWRSC